MASNEDDVDVEAASDAKKQIAAMPTLPKLLTVEEKKYLLAVERGDMANVRRMLQKAHRKKSFDINCVDSLGRGALTIAIDQENLEMVELLIIMDVETRDALLHAINVEFVEAVELLLEHEELIHKEGEPYSWQKVDANTASFTPDITPLILAAHRNNYEILKILLDRGATVPMPHDVKCGCEECIKQSDEDSLRHSLSRLNEYKALASPSLIALSSSDPILTAFQLSWELKGLAFAEPECKSEYVDLRRQCQTFAVDLLDQSRSSQELAIILNHDPDSPAYEEGDHMKLARLELAITYKQKKFVAHPNIQQLLAAIWYEGVPGFRRKSSSQKMAIIIRVALLFPFYCMLYVIAPATKTGKLMRKPFMKFLIHASSYLFFLLILILVSLRAEDHLMELFGTESMRASVTEKYEKQKGNPPMILEYLVLIYVMGFIYEETREIYTEGIQSYLRNLWNFIDFSRNFLYVVVFLLRGAAYIQQRAEIERDPMRAYLKREDWDAFDFQLIAEGLFAAANVFSALKLVHLFSINPHLGPLQISLGRMVIDIVKFFFIYSLVLFAFACGLNQLLWYFSDLERKKCYHLPNGQADFDNAGDSCTKWRNFANVFEASQSLFWASFGLVDLNSFELTGIKTYTRFWGLLMFGSYSVINVIVLLNLLIAMMSNSYAMIDEHSDTEWKFARTKLWMSYFEESGTLPPPFNIFPAPKHLFKVFGLRKKDKLRKMSTKRFNREEKERDYRYSAVMRALVWRYVAAMHRKFEESAVTEDDINELKSDVSAFRYELLEVLHKNGMDTSFVDKKEKTILGKKMKIWERRLMKDFKVGPVASEEDEDLLYAPPPENEDPVARFRRVAKLAVLNSGLNKWRQVVKGACIASQIGHCHRRDSLKKQQNLQKAIQEAKRYTTKSPEPSRAVTPIYLPDTTGSSIINIIKEFKEDDKSTGASVLGISPSATLKPSASQALLDEPDLINLDSQKNSPLTQKSRIGGSSHSFKFILGSEDRPPMEQHVNEPLYSPPEITSPPSSEDNVADEEINRTLKGMDDDSHKSQTASSSDDLFEKIETASFEKIEAKDFDCFESGLLENKADGLEGSVTEKNLDNASMERKTSSPSAMKDPEGSMEIKPPESCISPEIVISEHVEPSSKSCELTTKTPDPSTEAILEPLVDSEVSNLQLSETMMNSMKDHEADNIQDIGDNSDNSKENLEENFDTSKASSQDFQENKTSKSPIPEGGHLDTSDMKEMKKVAIMDEDQLEKEQTFSGKDSPVLQKTSEGDKAIEDASHGLHVDVGEDRPRSPLAFRNIHRVGDKKRQVTTGWL